jgi:hypothetical protein
MKLIKKYRTRIKGQLPVINGISFKIIHFIRVKDYLNKKTYYKIVRKLPFNNGFETDNNVKSIKKSNKIEKYWSHKHYRWVDGYTFFAINFIRFSLFNEKNKYGISFNLPIKYKFKELKY